MNLASKHFVFVPTNSFQECNCNTKDLCCCKNNHMVNVLKFRIIYSISFFAYILLSMQLFLKILSAMANSVDPIKLLLKEQSGFGLHCLHMPFCRKLSYKILGQHLP